MHMFKCALMQISKQPITWQHLNAFKLKVQNIKNHLFIPINGWSNCLFWTSPKCQTATLCKSSNLFLAILTFLNHFSCFLLFPHHYLILTAHVFNLKLRLAQQKINSFMFHLGGKQFLLLAPSIYRDTNVECILDKSASIIWSHVKSWRWGTDDNILFIYQFLKIKSLYISRMKTYAMFYVCTTLKKQQEPHRLLNRTKLILL